MSQFDTLRLVVRVARMYHEGNKKQSEIASQLGLSQATVSRLLNQAKETGIIRTSVSVPQGIYTELEEELVMSYHLRDALVVDCSSEEDERLIQREIGAAAAYYLENIIRPNEIIGISSWSATLLALVEAMHPISSKNNIQVVQIQGGVGNPQTEKHAIHLINRFANQLGGTPVFLNAPGIVGSEASLKILLEDPFIQNTMNIVDHITMAVVGIGSVEPSRLLADSGNIFSSEEQDLLRSLGAVGDIFLRFFDVDGKLVESSLDNRVVAMRLEQLKKVDYSIGVAGGKRKHAAIRAALRGGWIKILVTDRSTAENLI